MSSEAHELACEILEELLTEVTCDRLSSDSLAEFKGENDEHIDSTCKDVAEEMDLSVLLFLLSEDSVVCRVSHRESKTHIHQLKVVQQQYGHYCGHFAFHFALCALELCKSTSHQTAVSFVEQMKCRVSIWKRYWSTTRMLCGFAEVMDGWWPWTVDAIWSGCMERTHMKYLLECLPHDVQNSVFTLQYGYGMFQDELSHIRGVHRAIQAFSASSGPSLLVFILGVVNHWVTLLAYKSENDRKLKTIVRMSNIKEDDLVTKTLHSEVEERICFLRKFVTMRSSMEKKEEAIMKDNDRDPLLRPANSEGDVHLVFCDSNNLNSPGMRDEDVPDMVAKYDEERLRKKGRRYTEWERQNCHQACIDQRDILSILARCVSGKSSLLVEYVDGKISTLVNNYKEYVSTPFKGGSDPCVYASLLLTWIEMYNKPKHLRDKIVVLVSEVGVAYLGPVGHKHLEYFVSDVFDNLNGEWSSVPLIDEMIQVVLEIKHKILS